MDTYQHSHIPYVAILSQVAKAWAAKVEADRKHVCSPIHFISSPYFSIALLNTNFVQSYITASLRTVNKTNSHAHMIPAWPVAFLVRGEDSVQRADQGGQRGVHSWTRAAQRWRCAVGGGRKLPRSHTIRLPVDIPPPHSHSHVEMESRGGGGRRFTNFICALQTRILRKFYSLRSPLMSSSLPDYQSL